MKLCRLIYNLLFTLFFCLVAPHYAIKMIRRGKSGRGFGQRFGLFGTRSREKVLPVQGGVWIHAVSVGEVNLAALLIEELRQRDLSLPLILSTTTITGQMVAQQRIPSDVPVIFNPLDFYWSVKAVFNLLNPRALILVESEIWPNYFWEAKKRKVPILMVNARLSHRTEQRYHRFHWFIKPLLQQIERVCVQNSTDFDRFVKLGVNPERLVDTGSMKYDVSKIKTNGSFDAVKILQDAGWRPGQPIFLAGSTHDGEETLIARIYQNLTIQFPDLFLIVAPRHFERGRKISRQYIESNLSHVRRSKLKEPCSKNRILILDSTGELKYFYPMASVTFVGKSLKGRGGQNFLEPVQAGRPVLLGPEMQNFAAITEEFVKTNAVIQIRNEQELNQAAAFLLADSAAAGDLAHRAKTLFESKLGATKKTVDAILPWIINNRSVLA